MRDSNFFKLAAIMVAATIGEGIFALPYTFYKASWPVGFFYLVALAAIVITAHILYLKTLERVGEKERLLGLTKRYLGRGGFWLGLIAIVVGLLLALVAYLILGPRFIMLAFPSLTPNFAFIIFWIAIAIPVLVSDVRAAKLEVVGVIFIATIVVLVFLNGVTGFRFSALSTTQPRDVFLPFGILLLALAGWTGIEPLYESAKRDRMMTGAVRAVIFGTVLAAFLYVLFVVGIAGAALRITPDTLSGIADWALWKRFMISALGLFAIGTGSVPITHEIRNALEKDMGWHENISRLFIVFFPALLVFFGFNNFIVVLGLAGGCFVALQYLLIIAVGRRALTLTPIKKFLLDAVALTFALGAVYQVWTFVVR